MNLFIINTNKQADKRYEQEMIDEQKCAAYRSTKEDIVHIQKGDKVLLYSNNNGIIARGIADGEVMKKEDISEIDAEYYMSLDDFYQYIKPIKYQQILSMIVSGARHPNNSDNSLQIKSLISSEVKGFFFYFCIKLKDK